MNLDKLKEVARRHELREEWRKAIDIYQRALEDLARAGEAADPSLYNRIGDLELKAGDPGAALTAYELAADTYADQGFFNNAIALCGKILRVSTHRTATYLRLAELHASKNVLAETRRNLLEFAERMGRSGQVEPLVTGIRRFTERFARSPEMRSLVGEVVRAVPAGGESSEALDALAQELGLSENGPASSASSPAPHRGRWDGSGLVFLDTGLDIPIPMVGTADGGPPTGADLADPEPPIAMEAVSAPPVQSLPFIEPTAVGYGAEEPAGALPVAGFEPTAFEDGLEVAGEVAPDLVEGVVADPIDFGPLEPEEARSADPDFDLEPIELEDGLEPLPLLEIGPADLDRPAPPGEPLFEGIDVDLSATRAVGVPDLALFAPADLASAVDRLQDEGRWGEALAVIGEILRRDPDAVAWHQRRVELAYHSGERLQLVGAYLSLAQTLGRAGAGENAVLVYRRVIELDPGNPVAAAALGADRAPSMQAVVPPADQVPAAAAVEDFVDLGALILEPEPERDTRMRVDQGEPDSEEDVDFRETLEQFKQGIEANLDATDFQSHYDLGIAFKEMGLLDEAIAQFQKALRSPDGRLKSSEALGVAFHEKGRHAIAEAVLARAVEALPGADDEKIGLIYWLGRAIEAQGRASDALRHYERALAVDITFLDLSDRIHRLTVERVQ